MPVNINGDIYDEVEDEVRIAITYLLKIRDKMGLTDDTQLEGSVDSSSITNKTIHKYALEVYRVWGALFPHEHSEFLINMQEEIANERRVQDAIKAGGYTPTALPMRLDAMYGILIPGVKTQDKRFWRPMFSSIPELKWSNYA